MIVQIEKLSCLGLARRRGSPRDERRPRDFAFFISRLEKPRPFFIGPRESPSSKLHAFFSSLIFFLFLCGELVRPWASNRGEECRSIILRDDLYRSRFNVSFRSVRDSMFYTHTFYVEGRIKMDRSLFRLSTIGGSRFLVNFRTHDNGQTLMYSVFGRFVSLSPGI